MKLVTEKYKTAEIKELLLNELSNMVLRTVIVGKLLYFYCFSSENM